MITEVRIQNFKSIQDLKLKLGRVTVLIGANGSGKSNILEALAFASAAASYKLDNEFLVSRGIRVTEPRFMKAAFKGVTAPDEIDIAIHSDGAKKSHYVLVHNPALSYPAWEHHNIAKQRAFVENLIKNKATPGFRILMTPSESEDSSWHTDEIKNTLEVFQTLLRSFTISELMSFLVYSPEDTALRTFEREGQILPLGVNGEGLFKLLKVLSSDENKDRMAELKEHMTLLDWFQDLRISPDLSPYESSLQIKDRYLSDDLEYFDQRSSNEGFLFLLFYLALFVSKDTPPFFAIDNIDASLNPKLCSELLKKLVALAKKHEKQVILTTHNPAVLDGLDLHDDEQRLLVIHRNSKGHTKARRVTPPQPIAGEPPVKLSEAFLRGLIGGLPQNF